MPKKKTHEEFLEEVKALVGEEYEVIGKYVKSSEKVEMKHKVCGYEYNVAPSHFLNKRRCPKCSGKVRKNTEFFKNEVFDLVGNEYDVLGEYKNTKTKIEMVHNKCGHKYEVVPSSFLSGVRCSKCMGGVKKTHEEFLDEIKALHGDSIIIIGTYNGSKAEIKYVCKKCNKTNFRQTASLYKSETINLCDNCTGRIRYTEEIFKNEMFKQVGKDYSLSGKFVNSQIKVDITHNLCGYTWGIRPSHFLNTGVRCPKCKKAGKRTHKDFVEDVKNIHGNELKVLGEYKNNRTKVKMKHNIEECGWEWDVVPKTIRKGHGCPMCANRQKKNTEMFREEMELLYGCEYTILSEYTNMKEKVKIRHNKEKCEYYEWDVIPSSILGGTGCPKCNESKGEKSLSSYLKKNNLEYSRQYKIKNCRNLKPLPFDFVIFNPDKSVNCLIEYDGEQHYQNKEFFGGEEAFKQRQHNDQIKNQYCKDNNIKLIRIPYWDFDNIEDILNEELKDLIKKNKLETNV